MDRGQPHELTNKFTNNVIFETMARSKRVCPVYSLLQALHSPHSFIPLLLSQNVRRAAEGRTETEAPSECLDNVAIRLLPLDILLCHAEWNAVNYI